MIWSQQTNYELCLVKSPSLLCRVTIVEEGGCGCWHSPHNMLVFVCQVIIRPAFGCCVRHRKPVPIVPVPPYRVGPMRSKDTRNLPF